MRLFDDLEECRKHSSTYFNLPAPVVWTIAFCLPGALGLVYSGFSYFATLVLVAVGAFEKKSKLVRMYCFQFCFFTMALNILLTLISLIGQVVPIVGVLGAYVSMVVGVMFIVTIVYSFFRAYQYKIWRMPILADFIESKFM